MRFIDLAMKRVCCSALTTNSVIDVLNNDRSNEELLSVASESQYDDIITTLQIQATGQTVNKETNLK